MASDIPIGTLDEPTLNLVEKEYQPCRETAYFPHATGVEPGRPQTTYSPGDALPSYHASTDNVTPSYDEASTSCISTPTERHTTNGGASRRYSLTRDDETRTDRQSTYGKAHMHRLNSPSRCDTSTPMSFTQREGSVQLFRDPTNYGYDQGRHGNTITTQPGQRTKAIQPDAHAFLTIPAICACILCFTPLGVFAIYFAWKATDLRRRGEVERAHSTNTIAGILLATTTLIGCGCWIIFFYNISPHITTV